MVLLGWKNVLFWIILVVLFVVVVIVVVISKEIKVVQKKINYYNNIFLIVVILLFREIQLCLIYGLIPLRMLLPIKQYQQRSIMKMMSNFISIVLDASRWTKLERWKMVKIKVGSMLQWKIARIMRYHITKISNFWRDILLSVHEKRLILVRLNNKYNKIKATEKDKESLFHN